MHPKPLAKHRALRALAEHARPTLELLADASGRSLKMLRLEAEREGWKLDRVPLEDVVDRIRAISTVLLDKIEEIGRQAAEGGKIDKTEIDAVVALVRGLERIGEIMRPEEIAQQNQIRQDEDLAAVLGHINERIVELARGLAAKMVKEQNRASRG